jgi:predicted dehydrogenase
VLWILRDDDEPASVSGELRAPFRVGLAGAGWVSRYHLAAWVTLPERATVVAISDPVESAAKARAQEYGIATVYASAEEMLDHAALDAIDIAAPREQHVPLCRLAAAHRVAILCQKPLAPTYDEAAALVAEIGNRSRLMVHENWRFRPHYRRIQRWLADGRIGDVRTVMMTILTSGFLPDQHGERPALVRQPMLAGLERMLLMEILIHHIDTLRFLLGPLVLVGARIGADCEAIRGEDRASLLLRAADGAAVSLVGDFMAHGHAPEPRDRLEIIGTTGAIVLHDDRLRLTGAMEDEQTLDLAADYVASYRSAIAHFIDRLLDGGTFETDAVDNLETLAIVEAAYRSGVNGPRNAP